MASYCVASVSLSRRSGGAGVASFADEECKRYNQQWTQVTEEAGSDQSGLFVIATIKKKKKKSRKKKSSAQRHSISRMRENLKSKSMLNIDAAVIITKIVMMIIKEESDS